jgi:metal-responsive CopG/Arc/MetJ family transcriptional regulator
LRLYKCRLAIRLETLERDRLEQLIFERKVKNISQAIRAAIAEYLDEQEAKSRESALWRQADDSAAKQ